jgi:Na+-translocating ferredoxin:NAD+ oxidoreductase RNF subunit RnfB
MLAALSLIGVTLGATAAYASERFPTRADTLETISGVLLIGGLALLGTALPTIL